MHILGIMMYHDVDKRSWEWLQIVFTCKTRNKFSVVDHLAL